MRTGWPDWIRRISNFSTIGRLFLTNFFGADALSSCFRFCQFSVFWHSMGKKTIALKRRSFVHDLRHSMLITVFALIRVVDEVIDLPSNVSNGFWSAHKSYPPAVANQVKVPLKYLWDPQLTFSESCILFSYYAVPRNLMFSAPANRRWTLARSGSLVQHSWLAP